jgi:hypothetical protein
MLSSTPLEDRLASKDGMLRTSDEGILMIDVRLDDYVRVMHLPKFDNKEDDDKTCPAKGQVVQVKAIKWAEDSEGIGPERRDKKRIVALGAWFARSGGALYFEFDRWEHISRPHDEGTTADDNARYDSGYYDPTGPSEQGDKDYELNRKVSELQALNQAIKSDLTEQRYLFNDLKHQGKNALDTISGILNEEAEERDFCNEWDDLVERINGDLPRGFALTPRLQEFQVDWVDTYEVKVPRSWVIKARDEEHAIELTKEQEITGEAETEDIVNAVENNEYSFTDDDEYEAELTD